MNFSLPLFYGMELLLYLLLLIIEVEGELFHLPEVVLDVDVYRLTLGGARSVIETEAVPCEGIAVIGFEDCPIIHSERPLTIGLKIADGIACIGKVTCSIECTAYLSRLTLYYLLLDGHCFDSKWKNRLHIQLPITSR